jgi:hypothetical protein
VKVNCALARGLAIVSLALGGVGCGLDVRSADLFVLTRTGEGPTLTLLPNDGGTIRCDLAQDLDKDARRGLTIPRSANTVFYYRIKLEHGTIAFPDSAATGRQELSRATLFAAQAAQQACGLRG